MWQHGHSGYTNHKCRCEICCQAMYAYQREYKKTRPSPGTVAYQKRYQAAYRCRKREEKRVYGEKYKREHYAELRTKARSTHGKALGRKKQNARRARQRRLFVEDIDPRVVYEIHGGRCGICGEFVPADDFHVDHVMPLKRGGLHAYINVQPAHPRCNIRKGAKPTM